MTPAKGFISFAMRYCPSCASQVEQSCWGRVDDNDALETWWRVDEAHCAPCGAICVEGQDAATLHNGMHGFNHTCAWCAFALFAPPPERKNP